MESQMVERVREILSGVTAEQDITEIERAVAEVRGKIPVETQWGFWVGRRPCWEMCRCPDMIKNECPAPRYQSVPCWEIEGTYCKLDDHGAKADDTSICEICRVYKRWGEREPIAVKLLGKGINVHMNTVAEPAFK